MAEPPRRVRGVFAGSVLLDMDHLPELWRRRWLRPPDLDAGRFETEVRRRKQLGELASVKHSRVTRVELARKTQERYAAIWALHVLARLGAVQLGQLTAGVIDAFQAELRKAGR